MRLLSIAESFESPKRSNSTFKWLSKFLKDELMLDMSMKRDLWEFSKLRQRRNIHCLQLPNCSYIRGSKYLECMKQSVLQLKKGLCFFRVLKAFTRWYNIEKVHNSFMTEDLPCKSMDLFLYDNGLRNERVKALSW